MATKSSDRPHDLDPSQQNPPEGTASASRVQPPGLGYGVALLSVAVAVFIRWVLDPLLGGRLHLLTLYGAVAVTVWFGGWRPGALAALIGFAAADYLFIPPRYAFALDSALVATFAGYSFSCGIIIYFGELMRRTNARLQHEVRAREAIQRSLARETELVTATLASIGDAVIVTDSESHVTFINAEAERLTGWKGSDAAGKLLPEIFRITNELTRQPVENPAEKALRSGTVTGLANHTMLISKDGREIPIEDSAAPIRRVGGPVLGVVLVFRDCTEKRQAEQARARLAAIVEFSGDAIATKNLDGVIQTWNAGAERLFGYRPDEIIGKPVTTLIPPDRLHEEERILSRLRRGLPAERIETLRKTKDGRLIPVLVSVSPIKDRAGRVTGASKIIHDIADIVAVREAVAREKELLATTLASIGDGVVVTDSEDRVTFLNAEAERLTGWKSSEAAGQPLPKVFRIINEFTGQPAENPVEKALRLGRIVGLSNHTILLARDGRGIPIDDSAAPIRNPSGSIFGVVLVFRDATEQRKAQEAQAWLAAIVEFSGDAIAAKNLDGVIQTWNVAAERLFGFRPDEIIGKSITVLIPPDRLDEEERILSRLRRGLLAERIETLRVTKDGRQIPVSVNVSPIKDREGRVTGASTVIHDISERKRIEEQLLHHREGLERSVAERTTELKEALRALEELLYTIAHDLRAPNRAMQGYSYLLETEYGSKLDETATDYLRRINAAALRNDALIRDLLEFGRLAHREVPVTDINPRQVAEAAVEEVQEEARKRHASIRIGSDDWPMILANATLLKQILGNLLTNALKYGASDGEPRIELSGRQENGQALLCVKDNGPGIPPESQARIFEPFTRVNNAADTEGTGMGLAIVRKAAERMNGKAGVKSIPGEGSCFWVQLPLAPPKNQHK
jgi:PAS domain S-box-containing protein